ncbi:hypothetical protein [Streptomyces oceani]|uniref:Uncharacterized protein n=1 Tax=Streptomyces oceani TaxID=1075402 RepID=A0A1E7KMP5_9ACTN|nr:hypothetical protein [Streptomyces oceani]OEV05144.1 hypothetical protein AN216_03925 [Streptomyces oceani]
MTTNEDKITPEPKPKDGEKTTDNRHGTSEPADVGSKNRHGTSVPSHLSTKNRHGTSEPAT